MKWTYTFIMTYKNNFLFNYSSKIFGNFEFGLLHIILLLKKKNILIYFVKLQWVYVCFQMTTDKIKYTHILR